MVEDSRNLREMLEMTLRFKGYTVISAQDGEEALQLVAQHSPALVITDLLMPHMDGYALAYQLRKNPLTFGIRSFLSQLPSSRQKTRNSPSVWVGRDL